LYRILHRSEARKAHSQGREGRQSPGGAADQVRNRPQS